MKTKQSAAPWVLRVDFKPFDDLRPDPNNARTHSETQIAIVERSLLDRGWYAPIGHGDGQIIFGHARWTAARNLRDRGISIRGVPEPGLAPVVDLSHLSQTERTALALADNRLPELAGWDTAQLAEQVAALANESYDLTSVGFSAEEIEALTKGPELSDSAVIEVDTSPIEDRFWISVRGPLVSQAAALQALRRMMAEIDGVTVELGTVADPHG
jgi:ParB-like chromosome segregation protein Spo0J